MTEVFFRKKEDIERDEKHSVIWGCGIIGLVLLTVILLFFFHPRSMGYLYYAVGLPAILLAAFPVYYFLVYRRKVASSYLRFQKLASSPSPEIKMTVIEEEKGSFGRFDLPFRKLVVQGELGAKRKLSLLDDEGLKVQKGATYLFQVHDDVIVFYREASE